MPAAHPALPGSLPSPHRFAMACTKNPYPAFCVTVGGTIGAGKTELLSRLENNVSLNASVYYEEFLEGNAWLLGDSHHDPVSLFAFQTEVAISQARMTQNRGSVFQTAAKTVLTERCMDDSLYVFMRMHADDGTMADSYASAISDIYLRYAWRPSLYILVDTPPEVCFERASRRNNGDFRDGESSLTLDYLQRLHSYQEKAVRMLEDTGVRVIRIDGLQPPEDVARQAAEHICAAKLHNDLDRLYFHSASEASEAIGVRA